MSIFKRFIRNENGTTAVLFGLALIPLAGMAGAAVDYSRMTALRAGLQQAADKTAMTVLYADYAKRSYDVDAIFKGSLGPAAKALLETAPGSLSVSGAWVAKNEYKVTVSGSLAGSLIRAVMPERILDVGVRAAAVSSQTRSSAKIQGTNLDPEAADYNETQAYCYNDKTKGRLGPLDPKTGERKPFAKIADNTDAGVKAGPQVTDIQCAEGEEISFLLKNIREARTSPAKQASGTPRYFYTDAVRNKATDVVSYTVTFDGLTRNTLETILCDTQEQCQPKSKGGILPNNHQMGRLPAVNAKVCSPGKYLYFGWEDRIPGYPGDSSDTDFDDIRMSITCPSETVGPFLVRLSA
jgi:Flp pilus assembly pilin Flp